MSVTPGSGGAPRGRGGGDAAVSAASASSCRDGGTRACVSSDSGSPGRGGVVAWIVPDRSPRVLGFSERRVAKPPMPRRAGRRRRRAGGRRRGSRRSRRRHPGTPGDFETSCAQSGRNWIRTAPAMHPGQRAETRDDDADDEEDRERDGVVVGPDAGVRDREERARDAGVERARRPNASVFVARQARRPT